MEGDGIDFGVVWEYGGFVVFGVGVEVILDVGVVFVVGGELVFGVVEGEFFYFVFVVVYVEFLVFFGELEVDVWVLVFGYELVVVG